MRKELRIADSPSHLRFFWRGIEIVLTHFLNNIKCRIRQTSFYMESPHFKMFLYPPRLQASDIFLCGAEKALSARNSILPSVGNRNIQIHQLFHKKNSIVSKHVQTNRYVGFDDSSPLFQKHRERIFDSYLPNVISLVTHFHVFLFMPNDFTDNL